MQVPAVVIWTVSTIEFEEVCMNSVTLYLFMHVWDSILKCNEPVAVLLLFDLER